MDEVQPHVKHKASFVGSLLSGGVAGTTVDVALYPLDTIKVLSDLQHTYYTANDS